MALISSMDDIVLPSTNLYIGEVGLGGEVRGVSRIEERINEGIKLGFKKIYIPERSKISGDIGKNNLQRIKSMDSLARQTKNSK
ncbi:MAG: hypothetical protein E4H13_10765 [Calditrichales bacterium]|nr:MAG: hypothetical protein E4H13_10765 [Calditrichales bacterium]